MVLGLLFRAVVLRSDINKLIGSLILDRFRIKIYNETGWGAVKREKEEELKRNIDSQADLKP